MVIKRIANSLGPQTPLGLLFSMRMYIGEMVLAFFHPLSFQFKAVPGKTETHADFIR